MSCGASRLAPLRSLRELRVEPLCIPRRGLRRFERCGGKSPHARTPVRTKNGRGGIRTHAGFRLHDFQSCALSHSATRPNRPWTGLAHDPPAPFNGGSGIELAVARSSRSTPVKALRIPYSARSTRTRRSDPLRVSHVGSNAPGFDDREDRIPGSPHQRREWDSNPRGP